jgi:hypothetical protein
MEHVGSASRRLDARDGEHACGGALDVGSIRKSDGDAVGCWFDRGEIASDCEEVSCDSGFNYDWHGGGRGFGIDIVTNIVSIISLFPVFCRPSSSVLTSLKAWDEIFGVFTHRVRGGRSGLVSLSRVLACGTGVTDIFGVAVGPVVTAGAFNISRGSDGVDVGS